MCMGGARSHTWGKTEGGLGGKEEGGDGCTKTQLGNKPVNWRGRVDKWSLYSARVSSMQWGNSTTLGALCLSYHSPFGHMVICNRSPLTALVFKVTFVWHTTQLLNNSWPLVKHTPKYNHCKTLCTWTQSVKNSSFPWLVPKLIDFLGVRGKIEYDKLV